jgi:fructokinase
MHTRFAVVGEALVDLVASGEQVSASPGGSPYNVAVGLARLGCAVRLHARAGRDAYGELLHDRAQASGVDLDGWRWTDEPTTRAVATLDADGQAEYDFDLDTTAALRFTAQEMAGLATDIDVLHLGSLASWLAPAHELIAAAQVAAFRSATTLVSYDPNVRPALLGSPDRAAATIEASIAAAHLVKASDADVAWLYPDADLEAVARRWLDLGPTAVVITRGGSGALAVVGDHAAVSRAAPAITLVDTVGAGDAFMAGLLSALPMLTTNAVRGLTGEELADVLRSASVVAARTCERAGADPPWHREL